jgi:hypothetical protein
LKSPHPLTTEVESRREDRRARGRCRRPAGRRQRRAGSSPCEATGVASPAIPREKCPHARPPLDPNRRKTAATGKTDQMTRIDSPIHFSCPLE